MKSILIYQRKSLKTKRLPKIACLTTSKVNINLRNGGFSVPINSIIRLHRRKFMEFQFSIIKK